MYSYHRCMTSCTIFFFHLITGKSFFSSDDALLSYLSGSVAECYDYHILLLTMDRLKKKGRSRSSPWSNSLLFMSVGCWKRWWSYPCPEHTTYSCLRLVVAWLFISLILILVLTCRLWRFEWWWVACPKCVFSPFITFTVSQILFSIPKHQLPSSGSGTPLEWEKGNWKKILTRHGWKFTYGESALEKVHTLAWHTQPQSQFVLYLLMP